MRIVLDTNVLIVAFITCGACSDLLEHCIRRHTLVASTHILGEFRKHMVGKFGYTAAEEAEEAITLLRPSLPYVTDGTPMMPKERCLTLMCRR